MERGPKSSLDWKKAKRSSRPTPHHSLMASLSKRSSRQIHRLLPQTCLENLSDEFQVRANTDSNKSPSRRGLFLAASVRNDLEPSVTSMVWSAATPRNLWVVRLVGQVMVNSDTVVCAESP